MSVFRSCDLLRISSPIRIIILVLSLMSVFFQSGKASLAASTASVTSFLPARHAVPKTSPVAGSKNLKLFYTTLSSPEYTYKFGFLTNATRVIPTIFESRTPVLRGAALLTTIGIPARATLPVIFHSHAKSAVRYKRISSVIVL